MRDGIHTAMFEAAARARMVAAMLMAAFWPGRDAPDLAARIEAQQPRAQAAIVGGVLGMLFLLSLFSAQFGLLGIALFWGAVVLVVA